jgi:hypothetical protein
MQCREPTPLPTADVIIALLSDDEIVSVNKHAAADHSDVDEYVDLEQVEQGVRRGLGPPRPICRVLPRKAVREATWATIVSWLGADKAPSSCTRRCSTPSVPRTGPLRAKKSRASGK